MPVIDPGDPEQVMALGRYVAQPAQHGQSCAVHRQLGPCVDCHIEARANAEMNQIAAEIMSRTYDSGRAT